jgi:2,3-dihydroxyphenylpropionate 1,2-dioxygenase
MEIVGAFACSHAGLLVTRRDLAPTKMCEHVYAGFAKMGQAIAAAKPDAIVLVATDHLRVYPLSGIPQFTIGVSTSAQGIGDAGLAPQNIEIHQPLARAVLEGALDQGIDLGFSEAMRLDHSFITPLLLGFPSGSPPIIPIAQNCNVPPLPSLRRSHEVGRILGRAIRSGPPGRIVIVGTGGLSHWVGPPEFQRYMRQPAGSRIGLEERYPMLIGDEGIVNEAFDRSFIDLICAGRASDFIASWTTERIYEEAGNGAQEVRNWLLVAGAVDDSPADMIAYAPVAAWLTGTGLVSFNV